MAWGLSVLLEPRRSRQRPEPRVRVQAEMSAKDYRLVTTGITAGGGPAAQLSASARRPDSR
eukprot:scaffold591808_cov14-Prasinocladus_malaysianus.AAC.1